MSKLNTLLKEQLPVPQEIRAAHILQIYTLSGQENPSAPEFRPFWEK